MKLTLVTGNKRKTTECQRLLPPTLTITTHDVNLPEIQSLDPEGIVGER